MWWFEWEWTFMFKYLVPSCWNYLEGIGGVTQVFRFTWWYYFSVLKRQHNYKKARVQAGSDLHCVFHVLHCLLSPCQWPKGLSKKKYVWSKVGNVQAVVTHVTRFSYSKRQAQAWILCLKMVRRQSFEDDIGANHLLKE